MYQFLSFSEELRLNYLTLNFLTIFRSKVEGEGQRKLRVRVRFSYWNWALIFEKIFDKHEILEYANRIFNFM